MSYKIRITRVIETERPEQQTWVANKGDGSPGWVNSPRTVAGTREADVLSQEVETLDLAAVIRAVNGL